MGKTVESYRMALEPEINRWSGFARALRKPDREAFDELMDMCRINAMSAGNACNPVIFEPMVMSILLGQVTNGECKDGKAAVQENKNSL